MSRVQEYVTKIKREPGYFSVIRDTPEPPEHIQISLELLATANPDYITVRSDRITVLGDEYKVSHFAQGALDCWLVQESA